MKYFFIILFVIQALSACVNDHELLSNDNAKNKLSVNAKIGSSDTRALLTGSSFVDNDKIGVALYKSFSDEPYSKDKNSRNTAYIYTQEQWLSQSEITLNEQKGTAYAYYPYLDKTNIDSIPISLDQTDYLWGTSIQKNLSSDQSDGTMNANIIMDHLLSQIQVKLYKSSYPEATVSGVRVRAVKKSILATKSKGVTFSARTGKITGIQRESEAEIEMLNMNGQQGTPLTGEIPANPTASAIILPTESFDNGDLEFVVTINKKEYSVPIPTPSSTDFDEAAGAWSQKFSYTYAIQFTGSSISISGVSLSAWIMLPHQDINIETNNPYKYSTDKKFCFYKKQEEARVLQADSTNVQFSMYANEEIDTKSIQVQYPNPNVVHSVKIEKKSISVDSYADGERPLGDWRYDVKISLTPNSYSSNERKEAFLISNNNIEIASVPLFHKKPLAQQMGFLPSLVLPSSMTLAPEKGEIQIAPYTQSLSVISLAANLIWNDSKTWSAPIRIIEEDTDYNSFKITVEDNNKLSISSIPNVSGHDISKNVIITFDNGNGIGQDMTRTIKIVHKTISQADFDIVQNMTVDINGVKWLKFSLPGSNAKYIPSYEEIVLKAKALTYPTNESQFTGNAEEIIIGTPAEFLRACPVGYRKPTSQEVSSSLFNGALLTSTFSLAPAKIGQEVTYGKVTILKITNGYKVTDNLNGNILWLPRYSYWLHDNWAAIDPNRYIFMSNTAGFKKDAKMKTDTNMSRVRCVKDLTYKGVTD